MKKIIFTFIIAVFAVATTNAQSPQSFKYQAVARNSTGDILANQNISIRISIHESSDIGPVVYEEEFVSILTNEFGLINLNIGSGSVISGNFSLIDWGNNSHFIEIEMDETGATSYSVMGTAQLLSVPYAFFADSSGTPGPQGPTGPAGPVGCGSADYVIKSNGTSAVCSQIYDSGTNVGIGTTFPDEYAILDLTATDKGLLIPRLTTAQRMALGAILGLFQTGLLVFDTDFNQFWYWDGSLWVQAIGPTGSQGDLGPTGPTGPTGPVAGSNMQVIYNDNGIAAGAEVYYNKANGKVGIGFNAPVSKLTVVSGGTPSAVNANTVLHIKNTQYSALTIEGRNDGASFIDFNDDDAISPGKILYYHTDNAMRLHTNSAEQVRIDSSGNVGIGTTMPEATLEVNGDIYFEGGLGDVNDDSNVNAADASIIMTYLEGTISLTHNQLARADVNADGKVTLDDANIVLRMAVGYDRREEIQRVGNLYGAVGDTIFGVNGSMTVGKQYKTYTPPINGMIIEGNIGIGTTSPEGALDVTSTTGGFIVPRMTTAQRDALTPVNGMIIYNITTNQFNFYENGLWVTK